MAKWHYTEGLHDIGNGIFAYLQPDGSTGLSNAGLIVDGERSLLVDTLFDLPLTRKMLEAMRRATPAADCIDILVNTHANLDHTFGNQLVEGAEIIASAACAQEMAEENPGYLDMFQNWRAHGLQGEVFHRSMARFDFSDIVITMPTRTFTESKISVPLGDRTIDVYQVGPAHTRGDVIIHSRADRVVYTGDILFTDSHPVIWVGPWDNWIRACELILGLDVDVVVPGHGPITDKAGVKAMMDWIVYLRDQARARYDAGLSLEETVRDITLYFPVRQWIDADRIVNNVNLLFAEFGGRGVARSFAEIVAIQERLGLVHPIAAGDDAHDCHDHG
jgi:glyoxylase-like metal-dependent hydrolase (beta-lactamase superfamily II)